ncbi:MAG: hypothetical protein PHQ35_09320 [Phycisphaerae bacterium]|nr:hypothetical protein [Phycisphaerae bacterium]MDD5239916.1 hypothetical protein [Candidatus Nanoarchaeia archaeon]
MLFKYYPIPLMDEIDASGGAAGEVVKPQSTEPEGTQGESSGTATPIPDGNKPSAEWAELRRKAKLTDDLLKENEGYKSKFEKIGKKALPEGYKTVDEYLEYIDGLEEVPFTPETPEQKPVIDKNAISEIVKSVINEHPVLKQAQKTQQDTFLVNSFKKAQESFPDIKKPEDIPVEVWDAWNEGKSNRTLLSHLKEYRYDKDIVEARKTGANQATATVMSTAHTAQVNGANAASDYDNVVVPVETIRQLEQIGIKDPLKQKMYFKKYHRTG